MKDSNSLDAVRKSRIGTLMLLACVSGLLLTACSNTGQGISEDAEAAGEAVEDAAEDAADAVEDAADEAEDAIE